MLKYKTMVSDYEGMQSILDTHSAQGWSLFSVTADTWRKSTPPTLEASPAPFEDLNPPGTGGIEYSASYYLLIFCQETRTDIDGLLAEAEEPIHRSSHHFYEG